MVMNRDFYCPFGEMECSDCRLYINNNVKSEYNGCLFSVLLTNIIQVNIKLSKICKKLGVRFE